ncbi:MAG: hypothetical protein OXI88_18315 [Gammaproteobacteria bacterium]|nr:hypothetical protein [Gammaproteobacteria bacterium]MDE0513724.1 hypothetical protein [Gammaproteobacteria bacterium]
MPRPADPPELTHPQHGNPAVNGVPCPARGDSTTIPGQHRLNRPEQGRNGGCDLPF